MTVREDVLALVAAMAPDTAGEPDLNSALIGDLGYTSLRLVELSIAVERAFGLPQLNPELLAGVYTVGDLVNLVEAQKERI
ncbi:acyl carrier protein [Mycolicibacterium sp. BK556]|uniref:acyl carrier protein n=1 Tax=Mycobacteriaceae TaxID=1762 RepID=UPI00105FE3D4|nr:MULTISPECIES: acyl carrier protein [Mycobacteriaceae]MBB3605105.1 acyl carrier protein [Mycolicibacterium sp. BK556]MBB3635301.1 acyl carrier protein [Mycolicibacterium sp. BK607]MBB3747905.1 acyl carrier protein [Mycolicibacterium sp. BK634]TDO07961.1 acyl carrier protein [Mycobacterium sp. BK086]